MVLQPDTKYPDRHRTYGRDLLGNGDRCQFQYRHCECDSDPARNTSVGNRRCTDQCQLLRGIERFRQCDSGRGNQLLFLCLVHYPGATHSVSHRAYGRDLLGHGDGCEFLHGHLQYVCIPA